MYGIPRASLRLGYRVDRVLRSEDEECSAQENINNVFQAIEPAARV